MDETLPLPGEEQETRGEQAVPASWKDRLKARLRDHEEERRGALSGDEPPPIASKRFNLIRELGRGGMGVVLEAEDTVLERKVALKVLLAGEFASTEAQDRFQIEARAAARLRHPNIVGVLEVGEESGRQFLVMDLIDGESLQAKLRRDGPLAPEEAARLTLRLAEALEYAHQRSILHRDIKPGNILISSGRDPQPLLTDFGLAKEIDRTLEGGPLTGTGHVMGTPAYMPPEQARGESDAVGRRSDIYSLGATLYEMLVGHPPFQSDNLPSMLMRVAIEEPTPPAKLEPGIDRDLETICLKCLEKEPERRYGSAAELASDLLRYVRHESILARRPSIQERARKWLRRNSAVARTLGATSGVALVALVASSGAFMVRLQQERDKAEASAADAIKERDRATQAAEEARQALDVLVYQVRNRLADLPGERVKQVRRALLKSAVTRMEKLQGLRTAEDTKLSAQNAEALRQMGELAFEAGDSPRARVHYAKALELCRKLAALPGAGDETQRDLIRSLLRMADVLRETGELQPARVLCQEAVGLARKRFAAGGEEADVELSGCLGRLGDLLRRLGRLPKALGAYREAVALARKTHARLKHLRSARQVSALVESLAEVLEAQGDLAKALARYEEGTRLARGIVARAPAESVQARRDLLSSLTKICNIKQERGDLKGALASGRESIGLARVLVKEDPNNQQNLGALAISVILTGDAHRLRGNLAPALVLYQEGERILRPLVKRDPGNLDFQRRLGGTIERIGAVLKAQGDTKGALRSYQAALARSREQVKRSPKSVQAWRDVANGLYQLGGLRKDLGDLKGAIRDHREGITLRRRLVKQDPSNAEVRAELGASLVGLGDVLRAREEFPDALAAYGESLALRRQVLEQDPKNQGAQKGVSIALQRMGTVLRAQGKVDAALERWREGIALGRKALAADPKSAWARNHLAEALGDVGSVQLQRGQTKAALASFQEAATFQRQLVKGDSSDDSARRNLLVSLARIAEVQFRLGKREEALRTSQEVLAQHRERARRSPRDAEVQRDLFVGLVKVAEMLQAKEPLKARRMFREAAGIQRKILARDQSNVSARRDLYAVLMREGKLCERTQRIPEALRAFKEAVGLAQLLLAKNDTVRMRRNVSSILFTVAKLLAAQRDLLGSRTYLRKAVNNHRRLVARDGRFKGQLAQLKNLLASIERKCAVQTGAAQPATPEEHAIRADALVGRQEHDEAVKHYVKALADPKLERRPAGILWRAARAAARAGDAKRALAWLGEEVKGCRARLAQLEGLLANKALPQARRKALSAFRGKLQAHLKDAKSEHEDLAPLRGKPEFQKLFE